MSNYCIIPRDCHKFFSFLADLELDNPAKIGVNNWKVTKVDVDIGSKSWNINIEVPQSVSAEVLAVITGALRDKFGLAAVNFKQVIKKAPAGIIDNWPAVVAEVTQGRLAIRTILAAAKLSFSANILQITVDSELSKEMLDNQGFIKKIKSYIAQNFGMLCNVKLVCAGEQSIDDITCEDDFKTPEYLEAVKEVNSKAQGGKDGPEIIFGKKIKNEPQPINMVQDEGRNIIIEGKIVTSEMRELRSGRTLLTFDLADATDGISGKIFLNDKDEAAKIAGQIKPGILVRVKGTVQFDKYKKELVIYADNMIKTVGLQRADRSDLPRIELHAHTKMSNMDAVVSAKDLIKTAARWNHPAIAITDHGVVQAFPEAHIEATKAKIKVIYGMEGYLFETDINQARHIIILAKNMVGLKNLYQLVSLSHLKYYHRTPRLPRRILSEYREGLLFGSACEAGELVQAIINGESETELLKIAAYYDYLEIQPYRNNEFLLREGKVADEEALRQINLTICRLGEKLNKMVVATCDVHFLNPEDEIYRRILMAGKGYSDADHQPPLYFRTTEEMLAEFSYLKPDKALEVVVENPRRINDLIENIKPIPDELYSPQIPGAEEQIKSMAYHNAARLYGEPLPSVVESRLKLELDSIINHGFAVLYLIAHKLVKKSLDDGYLVGSRGSVGSSFVATMTDITEVNPLPPHWRCPECKHSEFIEDGSIGSGFDLPDKNCPRCGALMVKNGHNIPFAVFMGFHGDKVPDIDLNFSGEYQPVAHKFTEELFGRDNVFRAGTIATIADKTAYGYVKNYFTDKNMLPRDAYIDGLVNGCTGVKRTTGQHPGGIMVVPRDMDIHNFTPIQHPADDKNSATITTHFDYHSISSRLVKLDILGHDDPTVIKMLEDLTGLNAKTIPLDDPQTMSIFFSPAALGVTAEQIASPVGTFGIPEFGTKFVRQMLEDTKPQTFSELVRISGFSHGTDVWLNNAQDLIKSGTAKVAEAISTRDDIMVYLLQKGLEPKDAFKIMESVRKGRGLTDEYKQTMIAHSVPSWYIESCEKIKYMFPKAHAVAYVMMAFRIAYFKVHYPKAFYAAYFTVRAAEFDAEKIVKGEDSIKMLLASFEQQGNNLSAKEKGLQTILEVALEMYLRGFIFHKIDLYKSDARKFIIVEDGLLPPFAALQGVGDTAAQNIVAARAEHPFSSREDLRLRARISKTVVDVLKDHGCLEGVPETAQVVLFA